MLRIALLAAIALPAAAAVLPSVAGDTLTVTGDDAADGVALRVIAPGTLHVDRDGATNQLVGFTSS